MLLDSKMQDLACSYLQLDAVWGFIGKKERDCSVDDNPELGDVTVLHLHPIKSVQDAVRVAIMQEVRNLGTEES
jgi:hypothetical protein